MGLVVAFLWPQELQSWGLGWPEAPLTPSRVRGEGSSLSGGTSILEGRGVTDLALRGRNSTYPTGEGPRLLALGLPRPPAKPAPPSSGRRRRGQDGPNASELGGSPGKAWDCTERGDPEPRRQRAGDGGALRVRGGCFWVGRWGRRGSGELPQQGKEGPPPQLAAGRGRPVRDLGRPGLPPSPHPASCRMRPRCLDSPPPWLHACISCPLLSPPALAACSYRALGTVLPSVGEGLLSSSRGQGARCHLRPGPGPPPQQLAALGSGRQRLVPGAFRGCPCPRPRLPVDSGWAGAPGL